MALVFLSDVHLRLDRPKRGQRLAKFVSTLGSTDRLVIVGDLCDFWFTSRQVDRDPTSCRGLQSLAEFKSRGGELTLLPGNHDAWLGEYYERVLGTGYRSASIELTVAGQRIRAVHGHEVGARSRWKGWMESRSFLRSFAAIPSPIAYVMDRTLDRANDVRRNATDSRHLAIYRKRADEWSDSTDICIFGHIHVTHDDRAGNPRLIVLGGWHDRSSYFRVDDDGSAELTVVEDEPLIEPPAREA